MNERKNREPYLTDPLQHPEAASPTMRTKRAWFLILLTIFIPGSAQLVGGEKPLGKKIIRVTFVVWILIIILIVLLIFKRDLVLSLVVNPVFSLILIAVLIILIIGWLWVFTNTAKLIDFPLLAKGMRPLVAIGLVCAVVLTCVPLAYGSYMLSVGRGALGNIFSDGIDIEASDGRYNFLLLGGDAGEDRVGRRPDSISVISVDAKTGQAATIAIPRNTQNAPFPEDSPIRQIYPDGYDCGDECIINFLYSEVNEKYKNLYPGVKDPGAQAMKEAASGMLGIKVQSYVLVDMGGFEQLIDAMGGIKINAGSWVPISGSVKAGSDSHEPPVGWIRPGEQKMDGKTALWYGRSREYANDYARISRQQCVQQAMVKQLDPPTVLTRFQEIAKSGEDIFESDVSSGQLSSFVDLAIKTRSYPMKRMTVGPPDFPDSFSTYPQWPTVHSKVQELLKSSDNESSTSAAAGSVPTLQDAQQVQFSQPLTETKKDNSSDKQDQDATEKKLQKLAEAGDTSGIEAIIGDNGKCTPG